MAAARWYWVSCRIWPRHSAFGIHVKTGRGIGGVGFIVRMAAASVKWISLSPWPLPAQVHRHNYMKEVIIALVGKFGRAVRAVDLEDDHIAAVLDAEEVYEHLDVEAN